MNIKNIICKILGHKLASVIETRLYHSPKCIPIRYMCERCERCGKKFKESLYIDNKW